MIIGVTGIQGSGKGTIKDILIKDFGFVGYTCSDILREQISNEGKQLTRENLSQKGLELRSKYGPGILAKMLIEKINQNPNQNYIIDSLRNPSEIQELNKIGDFLLIKIQCDIDIAAQRITSRGRENETDLNQIKQTIQNEINGIQGNNGLRLNDCFKLNDIIIENNGTLKQFENKIYKLCKYLIR